MLIGISLGGAVTPETLEHDGGLAAEPARARDLDGARHGRVQGLPAIRARLGRLSALFGAAPGALGQAMLLATDYRVDVRPIATVQTVRLFVLSSHCRLRSGSPASAACRQCAT